MDTSMLSCLDYSELFHFCRAVRSTALFILVLLSLAEGAMAPFLSPFLPNLLRPNLLRP